jgi:hypothetical protein
MKKIVIIGVNCIAAKYLPDALRAAGYEPVFVLDIEAYSGESRKALEGCAHYPADIEDTSAVLDVLAENPGILDGAYAITSFYDDKFPLVAGIADARGLRRPEPAAVRLASKAEVMGLVPEYSPRGLIFRPGDLARLDVSAFARLTSALVLKPSMVSGGGGVTRWAPGEVSESAIQAAIATSELPGAAEQTWILQEQIKGRLVSLEGFAQDGVATFLCFSLRGRIGTTEVSDLLPADDRLAREVRQRCRQAVRTLIKRSNFRNGYFHCEFIITDDSAHLIDANMGRIGGATYAEQIALAHGFQPGEILRHSVLLPLDQAAAGSPPAFRAPGETRRAVAFLYGLEKSGTVRSIALPADLRGIHTQFARFGVPVPAIGTSDASWVGLLTGFADEAEHDMRRIGIETDDGVVAPYYVSEE